MNEGLSSNFHAYYLSTQEGIKLTEAGYRRSLVSDGQMNEWILQGPAGDRDVRERNEEKNISD